MRKIAVSVVIPVYNAEKSIKKCIHSAVNQDISSMEIICIDDGSTDTTMHILKNLKMEFPQISLYSQEHKGAGTARNFGIKKANGDYVAFLDSDDEFVERNALRKMVSACDEYQAIICGSFRLILENGKERNTDIFQGFLIPYNGCFIDYSEYQKDYDYQSYIFKRDFLIKNGIEFPAYKRYQDPPFFIKAMSLAKKFYVMPVVLYKYKYDGQKSPVISAHINHIVHGILDSLHLAEQYGHEQLFNKVRKRVDEEYREAILSNLSDEVMKTLIEIDSYSQLHDGESIKLIEYIYETIRNESNIGKSHYMLERIVSIIQMPGRLKQYFDDNRIESVTVYGVGKFGKILINELLNNNIHISCAIDKTVKKYKDIQTISPDQVIPDCDLVIVSLLQSYDVVGHLKDACGTRVISLWDLTEEVLGENDSE